MQEVGALSDAISAINLAITKELVIDLGSNKKVINYLV